MYVSVARRLPSLLAAVALLGMLAGCTNAGSPAMTSAPSVSAAAHELPVPHASPAIDLVGMWRVSDAAGETPDTWLRLGGGELILWRKCGYLDGSWTADRGDFLATVDGSSQHCAPPWRIAWLLAATGYQRDGNAWQLTDHNGDVVAVLTHDGAPRPIATADPSLAQPPVIDASVRAALHAAAPLPRGLTPARAASLIGTWVPATGSFETDPRVTYTADGASDSSDGCNGMAGRWAVPEPGRLLSLGGASTDIGCEGAQVPAWVAGAARAGFDGDVLVLIDSNGTELGRLVRD